MGDSEYYDLVDQYKKPMVITGFEPFDLLQGIHMLINQLENGKAELQNQYARVVKSQGNKQAISVMDRVFDISDRVWRGIGSIPNSGYEVKDDYADYDAKKKFDIQENTKEGNRKCKAGEVLVGKIKPFECPEFGKTCSPLNPLGAPMVSSEGACAAYYHYYNTVNEICS
jgi:hydrogenase expression/formation protein HypD